MPWLPSPNNTHRAKRPDDFAALVVDVLQHGQAAERRGQNKGRPAVVVAHVLTGPQLQEGIGTRMQVVGMGVRVGVGVCLPDSI